MLPWELYQPQHGVCGPFGSKPVFPARRLYIRFDIKCKMLEWFSRGAYKTAPFGERKNKRLHEFMLRGINDYLGTDFTEEDMADIYTRLGNRCNHELTVRFIESGYDMWLLREPKEA